MPKRKILIFIDWYLPGYRAGGPIRSVSNLVKVLGDEFEFSIVTGNTDFGSDTPYEDVPSDEWTEWNGVPVIYLSKENQTRQTIGNILKETEAQVIYFNSFFSSKFTILPLWILKWRQLKKNVVLAPRGMLGAGALQIKAFKKQAFIRFTKMMGLYDHVTWHASTDLEEQEIRRFFGGRAKVTVARNIALPEINTEIPMPLKEPGKARFFFLSRIALKKNLKKAITLFQQVAKGKEVVFDIYGPVDEALYWEECQAEIAKHPDITINYGGEVTHDQISATIRGYHFFFLPTLNENYGHVIVESFVNGCPVIISDQTPWLELEAKGLGWDISLADEDGFKTALQAAIDMNQEEFDQMSQAVQDFGKEAMCHPDDVEKNRLLFVNA